MPNYPRRGPLRRPGASSAHRLRWVQPPAAPPTPSKVRISGWHEYPPDRIACRIDAPNGAIGRWAEDEPLAENVLTGITLSDEIPGGCKDSGGILARDPRLDFRDEEVFGRVKFYQPGVSKVWEGYLDKAPDVSGDQMSISPACVGNQKHLEGNSAIKLGIIDCDLNKWVGPSAQRRQNLIGGNRPHQQEAEVTFGPVFGTGLRFSVSDDWVALLFPRARLGTTVKAYLSELYMGTGSKVMATLCLNYMFVLQTTRLQLDLKAQEIITLQLVGQSLGDQPVLTSSTHLLLGFIREPLQAQRATHSGSPLTTSR